MGAFRLVLHALVGDYVPCPPKCFRNFTPSFVRSQTGDEFRFVTSFSLLSQPPSSCSASWCPQCFCGTSLDDPDKVGVATNCDIACTGNGAEICGGRFAISVYEPAESSPVSSSTSGTRYLGCYGDAESPNRIMTEGLTDSFMTLEVNERRRCAINYFSPCLSANTNSYVE